MLAVNQALVAAGLCEIPEWGVTPNPDANIFLGLAALQSREGLSDPAGEARAPATRPATRWSNTGRARADRFT